MGTNIQIYTYHLLYEYICQNLRYCQQVLKIMVIVIWFNTRWNECHTWIMKRPRNLLQYVVHVQYMSWNLHKMSVSFKCMRETWEHPLDVFMD